MRHNSDVITFLFHARVVSFLFTLVTLKCTDFVRFFCFISLSLTLCVEWCSHLSWLQSGHHRWHLFLTTTVTFKSLHASNTLSMNVHLLHCTSFPPVIRSTFPFSTSIRFSVSTYFSSSLFVSLSLFLCTLSFSSFSTTCILVLSS